MNMKLKVCATIIAATLTSAANAGVVTDWTYDNQAGFATWAGTEDYYGNTSWTDDNVAASGDSSGGGVNILDTNGDYVVDGSDAALATTLSWGTPAASSVSGLQSSLEIDSPITGSIVSGDSAWAQGTNITHNNWVINDDSLTNASVLDGLTLMPTAWNAYGDDETALLASAPYFAPQLQFGINFIETNNQKDLAVTCPDGNPNMAGNNVNGCGDIFEIVGLESLPFTPVIGLDFLEFTVPFVLMGAGNTPIPGWSDTTYLVTTRLSGLSLLPETYECSNLQENCFGFVTVEEKVNVLTAEFKIRAVPEPSTLAIFGLGLIGFGLSRRKKA